jgi:hypothetical protein
MKVWPVAIAILLSAGAALAVDRLLAWKPLEKAKAGDSVRYKLEIFDASGRSVSKSEKAYKVDAREDGRVAIGRIDLAEDADAKEIVEALRLLPPGTPLEGLAAKPETVDGPTKGKKVEAEHVSLRAKLQGGQTSVLFDAWFARDVAVFGLLRARTKIVGGGAGESAYELVE